MPKRPKGRLFVGAVVLSVCIALVHTLWSTFFQYQAYGTITGRVISVSAVQAGVLQSLHVREGDSVKQGQVLATLTNLDLNQRLERVGDELRMAQADLDAEMTEVKWQTRQMTERNQLALAQYFERWGQLLEEQTKLADLEIRLARKQDVNQQHRGAVTREELDSLKFTTDGQRAKIEKLTHAVAELQKLANVPLQESLPGQLQPKLVRIETLQAELTRLRDQVRQTEIRSPVHGRVVKSHRFAGEYVAAATEVLEILEENSLEAIVYLPQYRADTVTVGGVLELQIDPLPRPVPAKVLRFGQRLETVPVNLQRYYRSHEALLPVHAKPLDAFARDGSLRIGSEIKLPLQLPRWLEWLQRPAPEPEVPVEIQVGTDLTPQANERISGRDPSRPDASRS